MRGDDPDNLFWQLHLITLPRLIFSKDAIYNAASWWLEINRHCLDHADFWWRIEDLDAELLQRIAAEAGWPNISIEECEAAIDATAPSHPSPQKAATVTWDEIPESLKPEMFRLCEEVGYDYG
jgi:hypothetical protein